MKPKALHWYVIAYTDTAPDIGICVNPKEGKFVIPAKNYCFFYNYFNDEQVIACLGKVQLPKVPAKLKKFRLAEKSKK